MDKSSFKRIYETKYGWIGRIGGKEYETFYFITVSQGIVSKEIAFRLTKLDVEKIITSNGDSSVVGSILEKLISGYAGYIDVE